MMNSNARAPQDLLRLFDAVQWNDATKLQTLLATVPNPNQTEKYSFTNGRMSLLQFAVDKQNKDVLKVLLQDPRVDPNQLTEGGKTPLQLAAEQNDVETVKILLADKRVNIKHTYNGQTAKDMASDSDVKRLFPTTFSPMGFLPKAKPTAQDHLIHHMQALGYRSDTFGVCFGVAHMGMQAMLIENRDKNDNLIEIDHFIERYHRMHDISYEFLGARIETLQQKSIASNKEIRQEVSSYSIDKLKTSYEAINLDKTRIDNLSEEQMRAFIIRHKIDASYEKFTANEKLDLEMPAFFEGIELYHHAFRYNYLFEKGKAPPSQVQTGQLVVPLILNQSLVEKGGIANVDGFSGIYDPNELKVILETLEKQLKGFDHPVSFVLGSGDHAISIGYDALQKTWMFVDANKNNLRAANNRLDALTLSNLIIRSFSDNGIAAFSTQVYVAKAYSDDLKKRMQACKSDKEWQKIHTVTSKKANLNDSSTYFVERIFSSTGSWTKVAIMNGETELAKDLMSKQGFFRRNWKWLLVGGLAATAIVVSSVLTMGTVPLAMGIMAGVALGIGIVKGIVGDIFAIARSKTFAKTKIIPSPDKNEEQESISSKKGAIMSAEKNNLDTIEMQVKRHDTHSIQRTLKEAQLHQPPLQKGFSTSTTVDKIDKATNEGNENRGKPAMEKVDPLLVNETTVEAQEVKDPAQVQINDDASTFKI